MLKLSIITTSYTMDRFKDIIELLDSIQAQSYRNIETIVVAERSAKLTHSLQRYIAEKDYSRVQVLYNEGEWGASSARNLAIGQVTGDIIAFVDDDAILLPRWAEETVKSYTRDSSVIGVTGPILPLWEEKQISWFPRELYWIFSCTYWDMPKKTEVRNGYGTNISFHREAFDTGERFRTSLGVKGRGESGWLEPGGEEPELSLRIRRKTNKRIIYNPQVRVKHRVYRYRLRTNFIAKRAYWEGHAKAMLERWYHAADSKSVLSTEHELLRRILLKLLPQIVRRLFRHPSTALRQLWVVAVVLSCVASGYAGYQFSTLLRRRQPYYAK